MGFNAIASPIRQDTPPGPSDSEPKLVYFRPGEGISEVFEVPLVCRTQCPSSMKGRILTRKVNDWHSFHFMVIKQVERLMLFILSIGDCADI